MKNLIKKITESFSPKNLLLLGFASLSLYLAPMLSSKASAEPLNKVNLKETLNQANPTNSFTQVDTAWVRRYNGPADSVDVANAIAVDGSGNVYVTGRSEGSGTDYDYATIKYDSDGVEKWVARYNGSENGFDEAYAIALDDSGNVYVTGCSYGFGTGGDYATIKYNSYGEEQWVARYDGNTVSDNASSIALDDSSNIYVTGYSNGIGTDRDYATIKYDNDGVEQWVARYNGPGNDDDYAEAIALDNSNNVYVTGKSMGPGTDDDYATIKYNSLGIEQWVARYDGPDNSIDRAKAIAVDDSSNVYVTGWSRGIGTFEDYATIKYNSSGEEQWVARYNGPVNDYDVASAIALDDSSNVYVTGTSDGGGTSDPDYATIKYNSSGAEQWVARYDDNSSDDATAIAVDDSSNVYVTGKSIMGPGTWEDYATVKYNTNGVEQWVARYNGPGNDWDCPNAIATDSDGYAYVTGGSKGSGTQSDYATIKYNQETGIQEKPSEKLENVLQAYPNPVKDISTIKYSLAKPSNVKLNLYNSAGEKIKTLVNKFEEAGNKSLNVNIKDLASGVYFYTLKAGDKSLSEKMVISR